MINFILRWFSMVFYHRFIKIKTCQEAYDNGLTWYRNVHGDEINYLNCRSMWADELGFMYRCRELYEEHKIEKIKCSSCGKEEVYIACPDKCEECYTKETAQEIQQEITRSEKNLIKYLNERDMNKMGWATYSHKDSMIKVTVHYLSQLYEKREARKTKNS